MTDKGGAPLGNNNAGKNRLWSLAIKKALKKRSKSEQLEELEDLAEVLLDKCKEGDMAALKELGDRLEGKPNQSISGPDEGPIQINDPSRPVLDKEEWLKLHYVGTTAGTAK